MSPCYDAPARGQRQPLDLGLLIGCAAGVVGGTASRQLAVALGSGFAVFVVLRRVGIGPSPRTHRPSAIVWVMIAIVITACSATARATAEYDERSRTEFGPYRGWGRVVLEATPTPWGQRMVLALDGRRFEVSFDGRAPVGDPVADTLAALRPGEWIVVTGERTRFSDERAARVVPTHLAGRLRVHHVGESRPASRLDRLIDTARRAVEEGSGYLAAERRSLFLGLVIGEDAGQTDEMVDRFRATGLSHLMVVSGANVAVILAAAAPVLRRLSAPARWSVSVLLIVGFAALTRFEPSILRASAMAIVGVSALVVGRERSAIAALLIAVIVVLVVDPALIGSYALWLSVGATAGICLPGVWLERRLRSSSWRWSQWAAAPLAATLGAQCGVIVPMVMMGVPIPVIGVVCNLLAGPVAGFVTAYGLPVAFVTGVIGPVASRIATFAMGPVGLAVTWIDGVARIGARLGPTGTAGWVAWGVVGLAVLAAISATGERHGRR